MTLPDIVERYRTAFLARFGRTLTAQQRSALNAITGCRTGQYGELVLTCQDCQQTGGQFRSCGHRFCNQCQQEAAQQWLARQEQKLLPVPYYLATFTLPVELRPLAKRHPRTVYALLMRCAANTLRRFGRNKEGIAAELGFCAVLHTHTRRLDYHPHVHMVIPGGGVHLQRREWRGLKGDYLFNGRALAASFRGELLRALNNAGFTVPRTPTRWIAHCKKAGRGVQALQYLSRYLYRGVITDQQILADDGDNVTFRYKDSRTDTWQTRTLSGEEFIALVLQHVLPKGFRRARDYGFLHGNARLLLRVVQWVLRTPLPASLEPRKKTFRCPHCQGRMQVCGVRRYRWEPG